MKKAILLLITVIILIFTTAANAEINISNLSYDELIQLQKDLTMEIMKRPEWKEVLVPAGTWIVGEDIPAGVYSFRIYKDKVVIHLWGAAIDDFKTNGGLRISEYRDQDIGKVELFDGNVLEISRPMIIAPKMSLGF